MEIKVVMVKTIYSLSSSYLYVFGLQEWAKTLLDCDTEFDAEAKYGLVKSSGITKSSSNVADDCLSGTFKKLDI